MTLRCEIWFYSVLFLRGLHPVASLFTPNWLFMAKDKRCSVQTYKRQGDMQLLLQEMSLSCRTGTHRPSPAAQGRAEEVGER